MTEQTEQSEAEGLLESKRSRAHFLKGAAVAAAGLGLTPGLAAAASRDEAQAAMGESVTDILNIAVTAEALAVTALYHVHTAVDQGQLKNLSGVHVPVQTLVSIVRAALREEQDHFAFLRGAGAKPLYMSFTLPPDIFTDAVATLKFFESAETIFVAAYMAANREFAQQRRAKLAQYAYQIGGVEAEHRTLMRAGLGYLPPNNLGFERNIFQQVSGAARVLTNLGLFKPNMPYPGAMAVDTILETTFSKRRNAGVMQNTP